MIDSEFYYTYIHQHLIYCLLIYVLFYTSFYWDPPNSFEINLQLKFYDYIIGSALLVWYHGPLPADYIGLIAEIQIRDNRTIQSIVDK